MKSRAIRILLAVLLVVFFSQMCHAHDISIFDVGTRITIWVDRQKVQVGFLVELKNFPAQDERKKCDLNKDMEIDEKEREYYEKERCKNYMDNIELKINGTVFEKKITRTEVYGMQGEVDRAAFSTYIEAEVPLDTSFYRVKIEYTNNNFRNEEPQIINDVNLSISKELDNLNVYPITPIVQYIDREIPGNLFMEMTLERQFFIEFGYRDVGTELEPFTANEIMLTKDSSETARQAKSGTSVPGTSSSSWNKRLYLWLEDFTMKRVENAIKANDLATWLWLFAVGVFVGLLHVLLPGHGKGVILTYVGATNARPLDAIKLSLMITVVHTISTMVLVAIILALAGKYMSGTIKNIGVTYLTLISGALITAVGIYLFFFLKPVKLRKEEEKEKEIVEKALDSSSSGKSSFALKLNIALATGIIPCITSSAAAVLCFNYQEYFKAFLLIVFIAVGQAITLSLMGIAASGGMALISKGAAGKKKGFFVILLKYMPKITAVLLVVIGVWAVDLGWRWKTSLSTVAQPLTADERVAAYEKILEGNSKDFEANFNLGLLHAAKKELDKALAYFERASELKTDNADALRFRAHALSQKEKYGEALGLYEAALKLNPEDGNILFNMAYAEEMTGRTDEAIAHYEKASKLGAPKSMFNLGLLYEKQSRLDLALECYLKAGDESPDDTRVNMAIANAHRLKKNFDKAVERLLTVHEKMPRSKEVNLALANIYSRRLEDDEKAAPFIKAYLENGGREEIETAIAELKDTKLETPSYQKWRLPESALKFGKIGICAAPRLVEMVENQTGEELKTTLAALALTESPKAFPCIVKVLGDTDRWNEQNLYDDYGPELGTPPIPFVAKAALVKCMRKSCTETAARELLKVYREKNNREYFLKELYRDCCLEYPWFFMESVLEYAKTADEDGLKKAVDLTLMLKGEALAVADDADTAKALLSYVAKWWKECKKDLKWDKTNSYFYKEK